MGSWSAQVRNAALSMALLALLGAPAARAQNSDAATAQQEIGELKRTVQQLNTRIENLEHQLSEQPKVTPPSAAPDTAHREPSPASPLTALRERWQKVGRGLSVHEVEELLGRPQRTAKVDAKTVWYYSYPDVGNGSVVFVQDDGVIDWQPPPFSVWWY
jgi:hypothetical protein